MAERSNAAVLKTVEVKASGGSNPSLSANFNKSLIKMFETYPLQSAEKLKRLQVVEFEGVFCSKYFHKFTASLNKILTTKQLTGSKYC